MELEPKPGVRGDLVELGRFTVLLCRGLAFSAEAFLHRGFGPQYVGVQAATVPAIMLVFALFWPGFNLLPLYAFLASYVGACVAILIRLARTKNVGLAAHYSGRPMCMRTLTFLRETTIKRVVEPLFVALIGLLTRNLHEPLGVYLIMVSVALFISNNLTRGFARTRALEPNNLPKTSSPLAVSVRRLEAAPSMSWEQPTPNFGDQA